MKTEKQVHLDLAFVMTKKDLSKLNEIVRGYLGPDASVKYRIRCSGNLTLNWDSVTPLQEYENPPRKAIRSLEINGTSEDYKKLVSVELGRPDSKFFAGYVVVSGDGVPEASIHNAFQALEDVCEGMKTWYNRVATAGFILGFMLVSIVVLAVAFVIILAMHGRPRGPITETHIIGWAAGAAIGNVLPAMLFFVQSTVFPKATFALGQGERRYQNAEILRIVFLVGFAINLIAGVIVSIMFM
jgi:hypothetical protein